MSYNPALTVLDHQHSSAYLWSWWQERLESQRLEKRPPYRQVATRAAGPPQAPASSEWPGKTAWASLELSCPCRSQSPSSAQYTPLYWWWPLWSARGHCTTSARRLCPGWAPSPEPLQWQSACLVLLGEKKEKKHYRDGNEKQWLIFQV